LGGFTLGGLYSNPVGIASNTLTGNLLISHTGAVAEWTQAGVQVGQLFSTAAGGLSGTIAGFTHIPASNHYLAVSGTTLYEFDALGNSVQSFFLSSFGINNAQGIDYDPFTGLVTICDNTTVTMHVFLDLNAGPEYMTNTPNASFALNGVQGSPSVPAMVTINAGQSAQLTATASTLQGFPFELAIGLLPLINVSQGALTTVEGQILNINHADPNLALLFNGFLSPPFLNISAPLPYPVPGAFSMHLGIVDPSQPSNLRLSQAVRLQIL
jgi:hypothetical protein